MLHSLMEPEYFTALWHITTLEFNLDTVIAKARNQSVLLPEEDVCKNDTKDYREYVNC